MRVFALASMLSLVLSACQQDEGTSTEISDVGLPAMGSPEHPAMQRHKQDIREQAAANRRLEGVRVDASFFGRWQRYIPATTNTKSVTFCDPANTLIVSGNGAWSYDGETGEWALRGGRQLSLDDGGDSYEVTINRLDDTIAVFHFQGDDPTNWIKANFNHCPGPTPVLPTPYPIPYLLEEISATTPRTRGEVMLVISWYNFNQRCQSGDEYSCEREPAALAAVNFCIGRVGVPQDRWTIHKCEAGSLKPDGSPFTSPS